MYIGPERHRPGHQTGGLSEAESFPKVRTQARSMTAQGRLSLPGIFPKIYMDSDRHGLWQKTGGLSEAESFPKSLSGLLVERIFLESRKHKNPGVNQKYLSY